MTYSNVDPRFPATALGFVAVVAYFYHRREARELPPRRPRLAWMPKYRAGCRLPASIVGAPDPERALTRRLAELGFTCDRQTPLVLHFTRGHAHGDFSVELAKINVILSLPLEAETKINVEADWVAAFDTGDLWQLTSELVELLESTPVKKKADLGRAA